MGSSSAQDQDPYDLVAYPGVVHRQTHPIRMRTIASAFGRTPPPVAGCRVLGIGCGNGANLLPLAEAYPSSEFVGIDTSARQIEAGADVALSLGVQNLRLLERSVTDLDEGLGEFDYIVCHGVYSWVPPAVRSAILDATARLLSADGVGYISYNSLPGWNVGGILRAAMLSAVGDATHPRDQIRRARPVLELLAEDPPADDPHRVLLCSAARDLLGKPEWYLLHEYLAPFNEALYVGEFVGRVGAHGLTYLGEATPSGIFADSARAVGEYVPEAMFESHLDAVQLADVFRYSIFRHALVDRGPPVSAPALSSEMLSAAHVASSLVPESAAAEEGRRVFVDPQGSRLAMSSPGVEQLLVAAGPQWPQSVAITDVLGSVDEEGLADALLASWLQGALELLIEPFDFTREISSRPQVPGTARRAANAGSNLVNRRHDNLDVDATMRWVIPQLDGSRDRDALVGLAVAAEQAGGLELASSGDSGAEVAPTSPATVDKLIAAALAALAGSALLVA